VRIIGWGKTADGTDYWLCSNSFNEEWGENGYFRIKMGECKIEEKVTTIIVDT
jgi:cathepsin B